MVRYFMFDKVQIESLVEACHERLKSLHAEIIQEDGGDERMNRKFFALKNMIEEFEQDVFEKRKEELSD